MKRTLWALILTAAFLSLTAEDCFLKTQTVEVPVANSEKVMFHTQGTAQNTDMEDVDFKDALLDLEADNDFDLLLSANIENAWWRVESNNGDGGLSAMGDVTVELLPAVKPGATPLSVAVPILSYQTQSIDAALGAFQPVALNEQGVSLMNDAFDAWLQAKASGTPDDQLPSVNFRFVWHATISPADPPPNVDFIWGGKIQFTLVGVVDVDVPDF